MGNGNAVDMHCSSSSRLEHSEAVSKYVQPSTTTWQPSKSYLQDVHRDRLLVEKLRGKRRRVEVDEQDHFPTGGTFQFDNYQTGRPSSNPLVGGAECLEAPVYRLANRYPVGGEQNSLLQDSDRGDLSSLCNFGEDGLLDRDLERQRLQQQIQLFCQGRALSDTDDYNIYDARSILRDFGGAEPLLLSPSNFREQNDKVALEKGLAILQESMNQHELLGARFRTSAQEADAPVHTNANNASRAPVGRADWVCSAPEDTFGSVPKDDPDSKRAVRLAKKREAGLRSRLRQKMVVENLKLKLRDLQESNGNLKMRNILLDREHKLLTRILANYLEAMGASKH